MTKKNATCMSLREELEQLAHDFQHLKTEHNQLSPGSSQRRHLEAKMAELERKFTSLLEHWITDPAVREGWRRRFHHGEPAPDEPALESGLLFRGRSDAGALVELRLDREGRCEVWVDGELVGRHDEQPQLDAQPREEPYELFGFRLYEEFAAAPEALAALADYRARPSGEPPWEHAAALLADGLIDRHFAITPRGRRALATLAAGT
ncbi:MAG: hypothetical protein KatS3mg102_2620 [Planctomycetota bacterium]|nr:MAG: hypothetical protein KatS3mg102_2620 [Planctomycetota bacterium]